MLINILNIHFPLPITGIIHVGSHMCEERDIYLSFVTENNIVWFDANSYCVDFIKQQFPSTVIFNECFSNKDNEIVTFNITNNIQSSSFLNLKEHYTEHPDIFTVDTRQLTTNTLNTFFKQHTEFDSHQFNFLNIDVQGAELLILQGTDITKYDYIYLECSIAELYENGALFSQIYQYLMPYFNIREINMTNHKWGDVLFFKKELYPPFKIYYGISDNNIDVTQLCIKQSLSHPNKSIIIPTNDEHRASLFTDPCFGTQKYIFVQYSKSSNKHGKAFAFDSNTPVVL